METRRLAGEATAILTEASLVSVVACTDSGGAYTVFVTRNIVDGLTFVGARKLRSTGIETEAK